MNAGTQMEKTKTDSRINRCRKDHPVIYFWEDKCPLCEVLAAIDDLKKRIEPPVPLLLSPPMSPSLTE